MEQGAATGEVGGPEAIGEQSIVANALEAGRQDMEQEAPDELRRLERHGAAAVWIGGAIVLVLESNVLIVVMEQPLIGEGDAMGVSAQVFNDMGGAAKGRFGVDDPLAGADGSQEVVEGVGIQQGVQLAMEVELTCVIGPLKSFEKEAAEKPGQDSNAEKEVGAAVDPPLAVRGEAAARDHAVDMRMEQKILSPSMKDGEEADGGAEMFGVGGNGE